MLKVFVLGMRSSLPDGWLLAKTRALRSGPVNKVYVRLERKLQTFLRGLMVGAQRKPWAHRAIPEATKESRRRFLARENRPLPELIAALSLKYPARGSSTLGDLVKVAAT
jgi:hypothetical protein